MEINFIGKKVGREKRKNIREAVRFYAAELLHPRIVKNLHIKMNIKQMDNNYGLCDYEQHDYYNPRDFVIDLDPRLSPRMTLITLAHETVHVKQYATGELKDYVRNPNMVRWRGKPMKSKKEPQDPSEREAYRLEKILYRKYKEVKNDT